MLSNALALTGLLDCRSTVAKSAEALKERCEELAQENAQRPFEKRSQGGAKTFQPTTPTAKTAPPPVDRAHRIESTGSAPSSPPTLGKRQRDFVTLCDPQKGSFHDADVRRIAYAEMELNLQEVMSDEAFDRKFWDRFHEDHATDIRLTKQDGHDLSVEFMAMR